jgi:site-specific DNA-adenine methylase
MSLSPLFPFYGSKWRDARRYPKPRYSDIIEPFAGSAGYSLWHNADRVTLIDIDPIITGVWQYLTTVTATELLALPDLAPGQSTDDLAVPQEARWLIGFWLNRGSAQPKKHQTAYSRRTERQQLVWGERARHRLAASVAEVRHWNVICGDYSLAPRRRGALYFVDPPYVEKGRYYRCGKVEHDQVGAWAKDLPGDVVVCEQAGATWLPFETVASIKSTRGRSDEVAWIQRAAL